MSYSIYSLLGLFLVYAFLGWCVEVSFVAVTLGQVVNRGFLNGPVCPIYGVGMLGVLLLLEPVSGNLILLFLGGMVLCSLVEVFALRLVHPTVALMLSLVPRGLGWVLLGVLYGLFLTDLVLTLVTIVGMKKRLGELDRVGQALHAVGDTISDRVGNTALAADAKLDAIRESGQGKVTEGKEKMAAALESGQERLDALKESGQERLEGTLEELQERKRQLELRRQRLLAEYRNHPRFGVRRIGRAFPAVKRAIGEHLREMDRE